MGVLLVFIGLIHFTTSTTKVYDNYYNRPLTVEEVKEYGEKGLLGECTFPVEDCVPNEYRREDGSCYNFNYPAIGTRHTPFIRFLDEVFSEGNEPRKSESGEELPPVRVISTKILGRGKAINSKLTQLALHFSLAVAVDSTTVHDTMNYLKTTTTCCTEEGKDNYMCIPIKVPDDDPVHRFSGIKCMNLTRPMSFYTQGCTKDITPFSRIIHTTAQIDLSFIYAASHPRVGIREYRGGRLKVDVVDGVVLPPGKGPNQDLCLGNIKEEGETQCVGPVTPSLAPVNLCVIWLWRYHNWLVGQLAEINPCWDDEKLYQVARDLNIATFTQIYFYEWYLTMVGFEHASKSRVISPGLGFRDVPILNEAPQSILEFIYVLRHLHTLVISELEMYDDEFNLYDSVPVVNITLRNVFLAKYKNIAGLTKGSYSQPCGAAESSTDNDMSNLGLGYLQKSSDIPAADLKKGRFEGMAPYVDYLHKCFGVRITEWSQLRMFMTQEKIERLNKIYKHLRDVELLSAIWLETPIPGGQLPPTLVCVVDDQLHRFIRTDPFFYERQHRHNAFTLEQLMEIRNMKISSLLCLVGDGITKIQERAFERPGPENPLVPCTEIPTINLNAWQDPTCNLHNYNKVNRY